MWCVWRVVFSHQLPPDPSNMEQFKYLTCVKPSAEDEMRVQTPQMSDSGKQRSISGDLKLVLIDSALWERLKGPLTGNWYSQGFLCTSALDWTQTWNTKPLLYNFCRTGVRGTWWSRRCTATLGLKLDVFYVCVTFSIDITLHEWTLCLDTSQTTRNCDHQASCINFISCFFFKF